MTGKTTRENESRIKVRAQVKVQVHGHHLPYSNIQMERKIRGASRRV